MSRVFIVSAPSGAGKSSLVEALRKAQPELAVAVSHTTRAARPGEEDGVHYHYVSIDEFKAMQARGEFVETAEVYGNFYGTSRAAIEKEQDEGRDVIVEIDWQGARQVRDGVADTLSVFILPPSRAALEERLRNRGQDSDEIIAGRMAIAKAELEHWQEYDYIVINDDFDVALKDLQTILHASALMRDQQAISQGAMIAELSA